MERVIMYIIKNGVTYVNIPKTDKRYVTKIKNGYSVYIPANGKRYYLGIRETQEKAIDLRDEAQTHIDDGTFLEWLEQKKKRG